MSYMAEVTVGSDPKFYGNALRFATEEEAHLYARDLFGRWTATTDFRVETSEDDVNYRWDESAGRAVRIPGAEL